MAESLSDTNAWIRVYPEDGVLHCPYCTKAFWRPTQRERHVRQSHNPPQEQWKCATCGRTFATKQGVAIHFASAHPTIGVGPRVERQNAGEDVAIEEHACDFCDWTLPSRQGLLNHEHRWHQAEVSTHLSQQPAPAKKRVRWTDDEVRRFKEALFSRAVKSNKEIAEVVATKTGKQVSNFKRRFLKNNPTWASLISPSSVSTDASGSADPPSSDLSVDSSPHSVITSRSNQRRPTKRVAGSPQTSQETSPGGPQPTPSPSLSGLTSQGQDPEEQLLSTTVTMTDRILQEIRRSLRDTMTPTFPSTSCSRNRAILERADKVLRDLRRPRRGSEEGETVPDVPTMTPTRGQEELPAEGGIALQTDDALQILEILVSTLSPSQREITGPVSVTGGETTTSLNLDGVLDGEFAQYTEESPPPPVAYTGECLPTSSIKEGLPEGEPMMPQQCTEERPPLPGWLYSPLSPSGDLSPMTSWYPSLRWPYSPVSPTRYSPTTPERGGRPREGTVGDPPPLTPTQPPSVQRHGPDYALRDYLQGNRDRATHHLQWPYSPLTPSTPWPVPSPAPPPGNTDWMDSQGSENV